MPLLCQVSRARLLGKKYAAKYQLMNIFPFLLNAKKLLNGFSLRSFCLIVNGNFSSEAPNSYLDRIISSGVELVTTKRFHRPQLIISLKPTQLSSELQTGSHMVSFALMFIEKYNRYGSLTLFFQTLWLVPLYSKSNKSSLTL
jgi:hypothetical protein